MSATSDPSAAEHGPTHTPGSVTEPPNGAASSDAQSPRSPQPGRSERSPQSEQPGQSEHPEQRGHPEQPGRTSHLAEPASPSPAYASPAGSHVRLDCGAFDPGVDKLAVRREGHLVVVELADHGRRNMMSLDMTAAWGRLIPAIAADSGVRAVLLTGRGSAFSSGGDTSWIGADSHEPVPVLRERMLAYYQTWLTIRDLPIPTIAAVNGPAIGAGAALALACDIRWAGQSALMSVPFLRMGLHPGMLSTFLLTEVSGVAAARDLLFTGRRVAAAEMQALGLVSRVIADDQLAEEARLGALAVAQTAPMATRLTKVALRDGGPAQWADAMQWEGLAQAVTLASDDLTEGLAALAEKRPPRFTGR